MTNDNGDGPMFSVVIPVYNRRDTIAAAIKSVQAQTFQDFEIIVVDDGSTDKPEEVIEALAEPRLRFIRQDNRGGSAARNTGIDAARGRYIAFLDSDDRFLPMKLARVTDEIRACCADWLSSYCVVDRGNGVQSVKPRRSPRQGEPLDEFLFAEGEALSTITLVVERHLATRIRFTDGLKICQDPDFVVRLYRSAAKFHFIPEPLSIWSDLTYSNRLSNTRHAEHLDAWLSRSKPLLSQRAYYGFRANVLSFSLASEHPLSAAKDILRGLLFGRISPMRCVHSAARAFIPRDMYRKAVDVCLHIARFQAGAATKRNAH